MKLLVSLVFVLLLVASYAPYRNYDKKRERIALLFKEGEHTMATIAAYGGDDREKAEKALLDHAKFLIEVKSTGNSFFNHTATLGITYERLALIELHRGNRDRALFWHTKALAKLNEKRRSEKKPALEMGLEELATSILQLDENMKPRWYSRSDFQFAQTNQAPQSKQ